MLSLTVLLSTRSDVGARVWPCGALTSIITCAHGSWRPTQLPSTPLVNKTVTHDFIHRKHLSLLLFQYFNVNLLKTCPHVGLKPKTAAVIDRRTYEKTDTGLIDKNSLTGSKTIIDTSSIGIAIYRNPVKQTNEQEEENGRQYTNFSTFYLIKNRYKGV